MYIHIANPSLGPICPYEGCAAIFKSVPAEKGSWQEITEEAWDRIMAVNVKGLWLCMRAVVPEETNSVILEWVKKHIR